MERYYRNNPKEVLPDGTKRCSVCGQVLPVGRFGKSSKNKDGLRGQCKKCRHQEYLDNAEVYKTQNRERYYQNRPEHLMACKEYRISNYEAKRQKDKQYYQKNKERIKKRVKQSFYNRIENDVGFKILQRCRARLYKAVKGYEKSARTQTLIGCSVDELISHLESQFKKGMSWGNYGEWHIDHIIPCASFDFTKKEDQYKCFHYLNLQPLWADENYRKNDKVISVSSCDSERVMTY